MGGAVVKSVAGEKVMRFTFQVKNKKAATRLLFYFKQTCLIRKNQAAVLAYF
jgi:hypothetical protein